MLALFILRTTLGQCENLTDAVLSKKLQISPEETKELVQNLHEEHVIRFKYTFECPNCGEMDTFYENERKAEQCCHFCGAKVDIQRIINGASIRYILDRDDLWEYMQENYKEELLAARNGEKPKPKLVPFTQTKDKTNREDTMKSVKKEYKLFISHASKDVKYVRAFVEFLEGIGMPEGSIFCSSVEGYKMSWGEDIYACLEAEFNNPDKELIVLFMLSDNYYKSAPCLNEMGAAWILKKEYRSILLPGFEFKKIEGAINANKIGIKFDDAQLKFQLNDIKKQMSQWFGLEKLDDSRWDRVRDRLIRDIVEERGE